MGNTSNGNSPLTAEEAWKLRGAQERAAEQAAFEQIPQDHVKLQAEAAQTIKRLRSKGWPNIDSGSFLDSFVVGRNPHWPHSPVVKQFVSWFIGFYDTGRWNDSEVCVASDGKLYIKERKYGLFRELAVEDLQRVFRNTLNPERYDSIVEEVLSKLRKLGK